MKKALLTISKYLFFLGLGIFLVWWSIHKMGEKNWEECKTALKSARYLLFIPVFFILLISFVSRAIRWKILMKPMGYNPGLVNTFFAVVVGYLANLALPRLGEVLKCTILGKYEKVPADKLVGTILVERVIDVVSLLILFTIAIITQAGIIGAYAKETIFKTFLSGNRQTMLIKLAAVIITVALLWFIIKYIFRRYHHVRLVKKIQRLFKGVGAGLGSVRNLENKWAFLFHTLLIWSCYIGGTYLGFFVIKATSGLPLAAAFPVLAFGSIGMIITPGGIGSYQWFVMEVMVLYGIQEGHGYANGLLQWVAQFAVILVVGFISLLALPYYNRHSHRVSGTPR